MNDDRFKDIKNLINDPDENADFEEHLSDLNNDLDGELDEPESDFTEHDINNKNDGAFFVSNPKRKILFFGFIGIILLVIIATLLSSGEKAPSSQALIALQTKINELEQAFANVESLSERMAFLEQQKNDLQQLVLALKNDTDTISKQIDELSKKINHTQQQVISATKSTPKSSPPKQQAIVSAKRYHTVRTGETLYRIASKYNMSVNELCKINGITSSHTLYPGNKLIIGLEK